MEDLKEVARLILLQVDHNRECGKDDKFSLEEIADIIDRRVVKLFLMPPVISSKPTSKKKKVIIDADNFSKMCDVIKRI